MSGVLARYEVDDGYGNTTVLKLTEEDAKARPGARRVGDHTEVTTRSERVATEGGGLVTSAKARGAANKARGAEGDKG